MAGEPDEVVSIAAYANGVADVRFQSGAILANVKVSKWLRPVADHTPLGPVGPIPEPPRLEL